MSKTHWIALLALVGVVVAVLLFSLGGSWILLSTSGGMMAPGASWRVMTGRLCPWCGGARGLLGGPRTLLILGLFILLPVGLLLLLIAALAWLAHRGTRPASPQPPA